MSLTAALSPLDGRYALEVEELPCWFSESALIRERVNVELRYLTQLLPLVDAVPDNTTNMETITEILEKGIASNFGVDEVQAVKTIEKRIHHDVKAVEYWLRDQFQSYPELRNLTRWIHFGLTSEDIDSVAYILCYKNSIENVVEPAISSVISELQHTIINKWKDIVILGRTHGQPASPTPLAKEFLCFHERLSKQQTILNKLPYSAKFGGATGNHNALHLAFPNVDWNAFGKTFLASFGLERSRFTKQTDHRDFLAGILQCLARICQIGIELCRDVWIYTSYGYLTVTKASKYQIGSSTMPHKVNPIDFENAEGNFQLAACLLEFIANTVTVTRLQRDLSSSTVLRNGGVALGHMTLALKRLKLGLQHLEVNPKRIKADLINNGPEIVMEGIQTLMRKHGIDDGYERCKQFLEQEQQRPVSQHQLDAFIDRQQELPQDVKDTMKQLRPETYCGPSVFHN